MSFPATIAKAIMDTVIGRLAVLFIAFTADDMTAAREAATQMLTSYNPETPDELTLAAEIISLRLHTLEALSTGAASDLSLNQTLRLRGSAVSLSRQSHKLQTRLEQIQRARQTQAAAQSAEAAAPPPPVNPEAEATPDPLQIPREALRATQKTGSQTWTQNLQKRMAANRMAEKVKKQQAEYAARLARQQPAADASQPPIPGASIAATIGNTPIEAPQPQP